MPADDALARRLGATSYRVAEPFGHHLEALSKLDERIAAHPGKRFPCVAQFVA